MTDLCALTATELVEKYRTKELSPVEVAQAVVKRMEAVNPVLNAFNLTNSEILEEAKASEARWMKGQSKGLLDGVPASIKDIILTKGWPTLRGSKTVDAKGPWNDDAPATRRIASRDSFADGFRIVRLVVSDCAEIRDLKVTIRKGRRFDAAQDGRDLRPARTRRHGLWLEFLPAPGTEDDLGRAPRHFEWIGDDAVPAE